MLLSFSTDVFANSTLMVLLTFQRPAGFLGQGGRCGTAGDATNNIAIRNITFRRLKGTVQAPGSIDCRKGNPCTVNFEDVHLKTTQPWTCGNANITSKGTVIPAIPECPVGPNNALAPPPLPVKLVNGRLVAPTRARLKTDGDAAGDPNGHGTISMDPNSTIARMPATHAGLIMEGVNHALYGYGLGSQMLFGEGFEEPAITDCTAHNGPCYGPFPEQWSLISGNASLASTKAGVFTGKQALRVDGTAQLLNAGLHRLGIASTEGWAYEVSFFYQYQADPSTPKLASTLTVALHTNELSPQNLTVATASVTLAPTAGQWQRASITLPAASISFPNCSLIIQIDGSNVLHMDAALMEPEAKHRWQGMHIRNDIADAIDNAGLRFMRFGGDMAESSEPLPFGYTWRNQIGDPQRRVPKLGGAWYAWDSFGFGMFEVLEMAGHQKKQITQFIGPECARGPHQCHTGR